MSSDRAPVRDHGGTTEPDRMPQQERRRRRRYAIATMVRSSVVTTAAVSGYFMLPFDTSFDGAPSLVLVAGLAVVAALLVWQVRGVIQSPYPRVRMIASLMTALPLFLVVFATTYLISSQSAPSAYSEPLSRLDALYFSVTVFSTVGFGDIVPVSSLARVLTMAQMIGDVVVIGLVVRVMIAAMRQGLRRQGARSWDT